MISCSFPAMVRLKLRRYLESSMSMAPPPATTESFCIARLTIMMASCRDRSVSSMNCSAPPRRIIVLPIHKVLEDEVEAAEGGDEGAGDGEHDDHRKDQHHPRVLLSKSEFIPDCFSNDRSVCLAPRHTNLDEIPKQLWT